MLDEYLQSDADEYRAADDARAFLEHDADRVPQQHAQRGNDERNDADRARGYPDVFIRERKRDADRERVDACRDGHDKKGLRAEGVFRLAARASLLRFGLALFPAFADGFEYHLHPDEREQREGDPMVDVADKAIDAFAEEIADHGHQELEEAEEPGEFEHARAVALAADHAARHGDCERVHRKRDGDEHQRKVVHQFLRRRGGGGEGIGKELPSRSVTLQSGNP